MKQEELIKSCSDLLYKLCDLVGARNTLNYYDINISSEYFFIPLLNQLFDCDLHNLNTEEKNAATIDLYDTNGKIAVQVTSNSSADKIHTTLKKYRENKLYEKYKRLIVVVIVRSHTYRADFTNDIDGRFTFSKSKDIYTISSLIKEISKSNIEKIASIKEYLEYQLDTLLDEEKVSTIEQSFDYISKNTNNLLNESYFEIDSERFIQDFQKKLDTSNVIHISSLSAEEGKYCILNLLHKICTNKMIYVIRSKENWEKAGKHLSNCILIPDFQADEIPACNNNITIFIQNSSTNQNALRLPKRTISFLSNKLSANGYDDPYHLLQKTHGLYYYIKFKLFRGKPSHPEWEKDNDKAVLVAALLGKWTECDGDRSVIEKLYGNSYDQFIMYLDKYIKTETSFIFRKNDRSYNIIYELSDPLLAICSHRSVVDLPIITEFLNVTKEVISERDPIFDEPFDKHFIMSALKKPNYSHLIKTGMTRTLILLALYADYQGNVSYFVKDLLTMIQSVKDWAYISQFIESLCEAAPCAVIDCIENSLDNHTGLLDLFTVEKSDILIGRHYYTHILWCLEGLLPCKDYAVRVVKILFEFGDKIDKCSTGNNPRDDLSKVFCTWYNVSALDIEEKIELAKLGAERYPFFWDILYNERGKNKTICGNSSFLYREPDKIVQYTEENIINFYDSYIQILLSCIGNSTDKAINLLDLLPKCTDEQFNAIQDKSLNIITGLCDPDKELIKTTLRKIIYKHRHFANSEWAASSERISRIEELCLKIEFDDQAYDFLYLTESGDIPIFNPIVYDPKGNYRQKEKNEIEKVVASEMRRLKESDIDLSHYLRLIKPEAVYKIGRIIAKYYCNSQYDEKILDIIINSTDDTQIAVNYVYNCSDLPDVYKVLEYLKKDHYGDKFYVAFLSTLPFDEKSKSFVCQLPDEAVQSYWRNFTELQFDSKDLLDEAIKNLLKFSNWTELYSIMHKQESMLSTCEILTTVSDSIKRIISEKYQMGDYEIYLIEELLSIVYRRIGNDFENYPKLFELEMCLFSVIGWDNMKCCNYLFKHNANFYAEILSLVYKKDDGSSDETLNPDKYMLFYTLEREIKFCPGEENGSINDNIFNDWINMFFKRLDSQGQISLFYKKLGKLFSYSPNGSDGLFPHETIREKIEEIGNDELIDSFVLTIINSRGIYIATDGKNEYKLAQKYGELSKKFSIRFPKTSKIFSIVSKTYMKESKYERQLAEDEII